MIENELIEAFWISQGGKPNDPADLWFYESSWDMLMPVVEKINKLDDQIHLSIRGIELIRTIRKYVSMVQIKDAHLYIVEFIKWHNSLTEINQ